METGLLLIKEKEITNSKVGKLEAWVGLSLRDGFGQPF